MSLRLRTTLPAFGAALFLLAALFVTLHGRGAGATPTLADDDRALLDAIVQRVEDVYYKPIDTRLLVKGERTGLLAVLKSHKGVNTALPAISGNGDPVNDNRVLDHALASAIATYGSHIAPLELTQGAIRGMLNSLRDPYTVYLTPIEITSLEESLKGGDFGGIGVYIVQDPRNGDVIVDPIEDTPAARAGLHPGDVIVAVDGHRTRGMKLDNVEHLIRGHIGTSVALLIRPHSNVKSTHVVNVQRQTIHVPSVRAKIEDNIDYVRLADFGNTSGDEVRDALLAGKKKHVRGYILDLRNNGGGLLDTAVEISSLFINQGPIVSTIDRAGNKDTKSSLGDSIGVTPLVLLVNRYTASASEITAGAVQDDHVGTLIGTRTFGKGVVQSIYTLSDGGALKVTTARYVTPAGRDIQHKGILPDIIIDQPDDLRYLDTPRDRQLAAAKALVNRESKK